MSELAAFPGVRRRRHRAVALAALTSGVLVIAVAFRALTAQPFWSEGFAAFLIGLTPLWLLTLARAAGATAAIRSVQIAGQSLRLADGKRIELGDATSHMVATFGPGHQLWLRLVVTQANAHVAVDLTDPISGVLRARTELRRAAGALAAAGGQHAPVASRITALADRGILAAFEEAIPPATQRRGAPVGRTRRTGRILYAAVWLYVAAVIIAGLPYYLVTRVAADAAGLSSDRVLGWFGVALLVGTGALYLGYGAVRDLATVVPVRAPVGGTLRQGPLRVTLHSAAIDVIAMGLEEVPGTHFAVRRVARPVLRAAPPLGVPLLLDLADPGTGVLRPDEQLRELAQAVQDAGAEGAARELREITRFSGLQLAGWLQPSPLTIGVPTAGAHSRSFQSGASPEDDR